MALQRTAPSKTEGVDIELPDFDEFFDRIQTVSPLARLAMNGGGSGEGGGFAAVDDSGKSATSPVMTITSPQFVASFICTRFLDSDWNVN